MAHVGEEFAFGAVRPFGIGMILIEANLHIEEHP
ncbi:MAG: hypothetical protein ACI8P0_000275 [Planctomycetaceae bacterium]